MLLSLFFPGLEAWDFSPANCVGASQSALQLSRPPALCGKQAVLGGAPSVCVEDNCGRDRSLTECGIQAHPASDQASYLVLSIYLPFCSFSFIHTARFINSWSSKSTVGFEIQTPPPKANCSPSHPCVPPSVLTYFRNTLSESFPIPRPSLSHCCERQAPLVDVC